MKNLRAPVSHDLEHGKPSKVRRKYAKIGDISHELIGKKIPKGDDWITLQLALLERTRLGLEDLYAILESEKITTVYSKYELRMIDGKELNYLEWSSIPLEKAKGMESIPLPSVPVPIGWSGMVPALPSGTSIWTYASCGLFGGIYDKLKKFFVDLEKEVSSAHGGISTQAWTLRMNSVIWPVGERMEYLTGISAEQLAKTLDKKELRYNAYLAWILETLDGTTYVLGGLLGHILQLYAYMDFIPPEKEFLVIGSTDRDYTLGKRMRRLRLLKPKVWHINFENKVLSIVAPHTYTIDSDYPDQKRLYTIKIYNNEYFEELQKSKKPFTDFLANIQPRITFCYLGHSNREKMNIVGLNAVVEKFEFPVSMDVYAMYIHSYIVYDSQESNNDQQQ